MREPVDFVYKQQLEKVKKALEANRMAAWVLDSAAEVVPLLKTLLLAGGSVSNGGSTTLKECGAIELLRSGAYRFLDREAPGVDKQALYREAFSADAYLASANAVTLQGEIYQIDGQGNRVAALVFGPKSVILVVGRNKIVPDIAAARRRRAELAAPANTHRLGTKTPCATTGVCSNCASPARICCSELVMYQQQVENRVKVILVNEDLGF